MTVTTDVYTSEDSWTVPVGVTSVSVTCVGGWGGASTSGKAGGAPGVVSGTFAVSAGQVLDLMVGIVGSDGGGIPAAPSGGGYGGGVSGGGASANGGNGGSDLSYRYGGGGSASYLQIQGSTVMVAGGGAGAGVIAPARVPFPFGTGPLGAGTNGAKVTSGSSFGGAGGGGGYPAGAGGAGGLSGGTPGAPGSSWVSTSATDATAYTGDPAQYPDAKIIVGYVVQSAPLAPTLLGPPTGATVPFNVTMSWRHNSPDPQAGAQIRLRQVGGVTWTNTYTTTGLAQYYTTSLYPGDFEWQARTQSTTGGGYGPWSSSFFFSASTRPDPPTITHPTTATNPTANVTWTTSTQSSVQVQVLTLAGVVTFDYTSGSPSLRTVSATNAFTQQGTTMQVRVRVYYGGVWSPWASANVPVSWMGPAVPSCVLTDDLGSAAIDIVATTPTGAGLPATVAVDFFITEEGVETRRAAAVGVDNTGSKATWRYWTPPSGVAVSARVEAISALGTRSSSAVTS